MGKAKLLSVAAQLTAFFVVLTLTLISPSISAQARQWKPPMRAQIVDYLEILDERNERQLIVIWWLASPMFPNNPDAVALFDKYVVIVALHVKIDPTAVPSYVKIDSLDVRDGNHQALTPVAHDKLPPTLTGALTAMGAVLKQLLGPSGEHAQYFVYESGSINACRHGRLLVNYNGEAYSYDTPIPGC